MGCCASGNSNRVKEPIKVLRHREEYVEDEKEGDDEKGNYEKKQTQNYTAQEQTSKPLEIMPPPNNQAPEVKPRVEQKENPETELQNGQLRLDQHTEGNELNGVPLQMHKESQHVEKIITGEEIIKIARKDHEQVGNMEMSGFHENKDFKSDDNIVESRQRLHSEESTYKLTKEQHDEILRFVDERKSAMQGQIFALYQSLNQNISEEETLAFIIEDLKSGNKDIENCLDDVRSHRFQDDELYLRNLIEKTDIIKKIIFSYGTYKKNLKTYREFKEETLSTLLAIDPRIEENSLSYMRLSMMNGYQSRSRPSDRPPTSLTFIPKEEHQEIEEYQANLMEDQVDLRLELK